VHRLVAAANRDPDLTYEVIILCMSYIL
jgi:hypothetical protein